MREVRCQSCGVVLQFEDDMGGKTVSCPDCRSQVGVPRQPPALGAGQSNDPQGPTLWSVPVAPEKWPTPRWLTQIIAGLILVLFFGFTFAFFDHPLALLFTVPTLGLTLACLLNGIKVARRGRRYTIWGVLRIIVVLAAFGLLVQPGLGLFTQAVTFQYPDPTYEQKLREVGKALDENPNDFRNGPARWVLAAGLRAQYKDVWAAFDDQPAAQAPVDVEFRKGFRALMEDLVRSGSPQLAVQLDEEVDLAEPPEAKIKLLLWKQDPIVGRLNWTDKKIPHLPKALTEFKEALPPARQAKRTTALCDALQKQFAPLLTAKLLSWQAVAAKQSGGKPRLVFQGRYKHSGRFVKMGTGGLLVMPAVSWDVLLYDRADQLVGRTNIPNLVGRDFLWTEEIKAGSYKDLGPYESVLTMVYGRTAWEVMRRTGLEAGPAPTTFP